MRPRQVRYQAALRPDKKCSIDSKSLLETEPPMGPNRLFTSLETLVVWSCRTDAANRRLTDVVVHGGRKSLAPVHLQDGNVRELGEEWVCLNAAGHEFESQQHIHGISPQPSRL